MVFNVVETNDVSSISQVLVGQDIFDEIHCDGAGPFDYSCLQFDFQNTFIVCKVC